MSSEAQEKERKHTPKADCGYDLLNPEMTKSASRIAVHGDRRTIRTNGGNTEEELRNQQRHMATALKIKIGSLRVDIASFLHSYARLLFNAAPILSALACFRSLPLSSPVSIVELDR